MKNLSRLMGLLVFAIVATPVSTHAQNALGQTGATAAANPSATVAAVSAFQTANASLSALPEVDLLLYINPQRILNEAVPKLMPAKDVEAMRKAFDEVKKNAGVDPARIEYIVVATRFKKPSDDLNFQPPEFMVVSSGDFSAESLMGMARLASQGKLRDEKYGTKTLGLMTIDPLVKEAEMNPFLKGLTEVGIVTLNANTIAIGSPSYLRAAIDAGEGKGRISAETLNSLVRDPHALISFAGSPWHSFAKGFGMLGTETNPRAPRCESKIGDTYAALTMDATNFMLRGATNADNPDTAKIISKLYSGLLNFAAKSIPDPDAQSLVKNIAVTAEGDEVLVNANFPQQMVMDLIQKHMKPKQVETTEAATPAKPAPGVKKRVSRRRRGH